jgi:serine/threonine protein kinase
VGRHTQQRSVAGVIDELGTVFATFDHRTQDSGNISYGVVTAGGRKLFAKTAGHGEPSPGGTPHAARVVALRRAAEVHRDVDHPALVPLEEVVEAEDGVVVVYEWFTGELLRSPEKKRGDPDEAGSRFRRLPVPEITAALDSIIDLHAALDSAGWVSGDVYDGCLMYDFGSRDIRFMDFESYQRGPYLNDVGRLPGSTRFMAPEEYTKGALIDVRTTIFNLGKFIEWFLPQQVSTRPAMRHVMVRATAGDQTDRYESIGTFQQAWRSALRVG